MMQPAGWLASNARLARQRHFGPIHASIQSIALIDSLMRFE
jgi:hypothetical protein